MILRESAGSIAGITHVGFGESEHQLQTKEQASAESQETGIKTLRSNALQSQGQKCTDHRSIEVKMPSHAEERVLWLEADVERPKIVGA